MQYYGQGLQDKFVCNILKQKQNGYFIEIGSNHPLHTNNTFILENKYNWKGLMIDYSNEFVELYKSVRPNSIYIIQDATTINYKNLFEINNLPLNIDYLQIDLEVNNRSTLTTLEIFDKEIFDNYKFATITFEHDIYLGNFFDTREKSREILKNRGYVCVFKDINFKKNPEMVWEDWYVHSDLVDMEYINRLILHNTNNYKDNNITGKAISFEDINYDI